MALPKVIIVGAGFGGLAAAIECGERGMDVTLVERFPDSNSQGDIIDFFPNGGQVIERWEGGNVAKELHKVCASEAKYMELHKYDGTPLFSVPWFVDPIARARTFAGHRGKQHGVILAYVKRLGIDLKLGSAVVDYLEESDRAGVELENGETLWADVVVAADGPRSLARQKVLHLEEEGTSSGWAIYRSFFSTTEEMRSHPRLTDFFRKDQDTIKSWNSSTTTMLAYSWNKNQQVAWVFQHPDTADIAESWHLLADKKEVAGFMERFSDECKALLEIAPPEKLIDFKLVFRPTLDKWTSKGGRTILIGDAAHANLPTAGQGGSQAIEDGVALAYCLEQSPDNIPLATEVTQRLRYRRCNIIHKNGQLTRDMLKDVAWEVIEADPVGWGKKRFPQLNDFDVLQNSKDHFPQCAKDVREGKQGTLDELAAPLPPGGVYMSPELE